MNRGPETRALADLSAADAARAADGIVDAARLVAGRFELAVAVRHASPLLLDAVAMRGIALEAVLARLAVWSGSREHGPTANPAMSLARYHRHPLRSSRWTTLQPSAPLSDASGETLYLVRKGTRLGVLGSSGRLGITSVDATAWLTIPDLLPETLAMAMVGRPIDALVSHPLLDGRRYRVLGTVVGPAGTTIRVRTGLRRFRTPWTPRGVLDAGAEEFVVLMRRIGS